MKEIRYSEISCFLRCKRQWYYRYKLGLIPRHQHERMDVGTAGHAAIETILRGGTEEEAIRHAVDFLVGRVQALGANSPIDEARAVDLAIGAAQNGISAIRGIGVVRAVEFNGVPLIESTVSLPARPGFAVRGTADEVVELRDGTVLVADNKFRKAFRPFATEALNLQMSVYQYLLLKNGIRTHGSLQLQVNSQAPKIPDINQNGTVKRAKISTTWEVYREAIERVGGNVNDYLDMIPKLNYKVYDSSVKAYRSPQELERTWENDVMPAVDAIIEAYGKDMPGGRCFIHEVCSPCEMRELCIEDMKGGDSELVQITRFRKEGEPEDFVPQVTFDEDDNDDGD